MTPSEIRRQKLSNFFDKVVDEKSFFDTMKTYQREMVTLSLKAASEGFTVDFSEIMDGQFYLNELCDLIDPCNEKQEATEENTKTLTS